LLSRSYFLCWCWWFRKTSLVMGSTRS